MSIYSTAVKRPLTTILIFVALMVVGLYSLNRLPVDLYPEIELPFLTVFTSYQGASASDIETNVTDLLEDQLNTVSNLKEVTSVSSDNTSTIFLEFEYETNLDEAANEVRDALNFIVPFLPEDVEDPSILKFNSSMMPIVFYAITADESYEGLEKLLDEKVINPLNRIEGIGSVGIAGAPGREIYVDVDPRKLEAYKLSIEQIGNVLRMENLNTPAGYLEMGDLDYPLRIQGEFENSDVLENLVVGSFNGNTIYLSDVADINDTIRESKVEERINGELGMRMFVQKQSGGNTVKVASEVRKTLKKLQKDLPPDVTIQPIFDSSEFIVGSINNLTSALLFAGIFVVLVVLFFLGRWRATFIVVLTIPISLIVAFIYLFISGNSINIISLSSLSIAIGMVVDDAIVILENITKHIERKSRPREAAIYATNEVWLAVIVTTLTVVAVFFPLTFVGGLTGVLFKQLGLIVTLTTVTSTIAAITLTPTLSSLLLRLRKNNKPKSKFSYDNTIRVGLNRFEGFYESTLRWALTHKTVVSILSVVVFAGSLSLLSSVGTEFIPESDESRLSATVELQTGTRVSETKTITHRIDSILSADFPEVELISSSTGTDEGVNFATMFSNTGTHTIIYTIALSDVLERERTVWEVAEDFRQRLDNIPEIINYQVSTTDQGMSFGGNNVEVEVYGYDISETNQVAEEIAEKMNNIEGARDIQISRDPSKPELQIVLDQNKMIRHGLNTATVSNAVKNRVAGMTATRLRQFGDEYDVIVRFNEESRNSITDIRNISIMNTQGQMVKLGEIAEIKEYWSPPNIEHKRKERIVTVSATPYERPLGDIAGDIQALIDDLETPAGVEVQISGTIEEQMESFQDLALLLLVSLVLVYIVMASQFESLKMPLIIMFSIPFSFSGVAIALFLTNTTLSLIAGIGAIMLIGIVVKNAIVLVDYINLQRDRGLDLYEAVAVSGRSRLRPVLMTSATTILGMLPLAISVGEGSEIWSPMGISVIGGLIFSTMVTLVLVPVVYVIFARRGERDRKRKSHEQYDFLNGNELSTSK
ncbi:MAG: efflux RND transporter permease subunit [Bacteroidales bacterium]|nr:efflux RND transporter permease subunit [Bacteroidales bacterium]